MINLRLTNRTKMSRSRGAMMVLMVIALPALLAITGLALDSGRAYGVKTKLASAVDAASLAAAKAVAGGEADAIAAANKYFAANYPNDYLSSTPTTPTVNFSYASTGDVTVDVSATANMPTSFSNLVGIADMDVASNAQTIRRTVDLAFVVDNTTSLRLGSIGDVTQDVVDRSKDFIQNFSETFDRVALVKYAFGAEVPVAFNSTRGFNKSTMESEIDAFTFGSTSNPQYTNASEGVWQAIEELEGANQPASLQVIVFFTDGAPNTFASLFEFESHSDQVGAIRSSDGSSGTPRGLWDHDKVNQQSSNPWYYGNNVDDNLSNLPDYYNAHDANATDIKVINPSHPRRPVTDYDPNSDSANDLYRKVNRISRNLPEDMAEYARQRGIYVLTLGLGSRLTDATGPDNEQGEDMLIRMANDPRMLDDPSLAGDYKPNEPQGVYCHAVDENALAPCFEEMLEVIIRLTI